MKESDRQRLIKLMGMLGSAFEGERANAAALATKILRDNKLTWAEFMRMEPKAAPRAEPKPEPKPEPYVWPKPRSRRRNDTLLRQMTALILANSKFLSRWELEFMASIEDQLELELNLSKKQLMVVKRIHDKVLVFTK